MPVGFVRNIQGCVDYKAVGLGGRNERSIVQAIKALEACWVDSGGLARHPE